MVWAGASTPEGAQLRAARSPTSPASRWKPLVGEEVTSRELQSSKCGGVCLRGGVGTLPQELSGRSPSCSPASRPALASGRLVRRCRSHSTPPSSRSVTARQAELGLEAVAEENAVLAAMSRAFFAIPRGLRTLAKIRERRHDHWLLQDDNSPSTHRLTRAFY